MLVIVVLGNRINDDGSMSSIMLKRLQMTIDIYKSFSPDKIILSGGATNSKVNMSEAKMMWDYLIANGIPQETLILETQSLTTEQNAKFSVPIAAELHATELILCTSPDHLCRKYLNPVKLFRKQLKKYPQIKLSAYCD